MKTWLAMAVLSVASSCAAAGERAIRKEVVVNAPVAAAWSAWATSEGIQSFFAPEAIVEARPEGVFSVHFNPYAREGLKGADRMRVLGVQENRMISFTWNAPPHLPEAARKINGVGVYFRKFDSDTIF